MQFLRAFSFIVLVAVLAACDQTPASKGEPGPQGLPGERGQIGPRDLLAPPDQLRLSVRRLTCV